MMMETRAKWDINVSCLIGFALTFIGIVYTGIGVYLFLVPTDPDGIAVRSVFLPLGSLFLTAGLILLIRWVTKNRQARQLVEEGHYVWATVTELQEIRSVNGFRGHPYIAQVCYTDPRGQSHFFQSRYLYRKPVPSLAGKSVKVYLRNGNYNAYYVDLEPLLR